MPQKALAAAGQALSAQKAKDAEMDAGETCLLQAYKESERNSQAHGGQDRDDEDDEDDGHQGGGQRMQCQQQ